MSSVTAELTVSGVVQGVGYRFFCYKKALQYQLTGWVKNNFDGSVSAVIQGEKSIVNELIEELSIGPPSASVSAVDIKWLPYDEQLVTFEIRH